MSIAIVHHLVVLVENLHCKYIIYICNHLSVLCVIQLYNTVYSEWLYGQTSCFTYTDTPVVAVCVKQVTGSVMHANISIWPNQHYKHGDMLKCHWHCCYLQHFNHTVATCITRLSVYASGQLAIYWFIVCPRQDNNNDIIIRNNIPNLMTHNDNSIIVIASISIVT